MLPYKEGTVFFVPLRDGGFARGVVARAGRDGKVLLGYFFGPRLLSADTASFDDIDPAKAILRLRFGDLGLINGDWKIRGQLSGWCRSEWPTPDFIRKDPLGRTKPMLVRYSDTDPSRIESELPASEDNMLATDSMSGYGAVELKLTKLLGS